jgi:predicted ATPase/DNA-binding XRE family transcriptional regulator
MYTKSDTTDKAMNENISFGTWLRQRRRALDLTQQAFADQVGCARITLSRIEADTLKPSKDLALLLLEKVGVPPSEMEQWVYFARGQSDLPSKDVQPSPLSQHQTNLPASITSFIGRKKEQAEVIRLLETYRLVTLTGSGGVGKTRLSVKVGEQVVENYADGVWLLELASLNDPALLAQNAAVLFGLATQTMSSFTDLLINFLRSKSALLILDNCEHLLDACARFAETLLKSCPFLKILATSREPLGIAGEAIYRVPSLQVPDLQQVLDTFRNFESMRLFEERAKLAQFDFSLSLENAFPVAQICHRLDGIPLAIELAAAKVGVFSTEQIAKQLDESFNLLTGGSRTALPRQQTLRASIDWSWNLLSDAERILLRRLSVFPGGFTLEAAGAICRADDIENNNVLDILTHLANKSLLEKQGQDGEARYRLIEPIRQYADEKLLDASEVDRIKERHLDFFVKFAEEAEPKLLGEEELEWLNRLEIENPNLRSALEWSVHNHVEAGLRMAGALYWFWAVRTYWKEGYTWLTRLLELSKELPSSLNLAKALNVAGHLAWYHFDTTAAHSLHKESLTMYRELEHQGGRAAALFGLGRVARLQHDYDAARRFYEESLTIRRELGDKYAIADTLQSMGALNYHRGDLALARSLFEESLLFWQELGNISGIAPSFSNLGRVSEAQGDYEQATMLYKKSLELFQKLGDKYGCIYTRQYLGHTAYLQADYSVAQASYEESLRLSRQAGDNWYTAIALTNLGHLALIENNYVEARARYTESLTIFKQAGDKQDIINCLVGWANLSQATGKTEQATRVCGALETLLPATKANLVSPEREIFQRTVVALSTSLDGSVFAQTWAKGQGMTLDQLIAYVLTER